jgi:hypothetical protein
LAKIKVKCCLGRQGEEKTGTVRKEEGASETS